METVANIVGIIGVVGMLAVYYLQQRGTLGVHDPRYLWANFFGALGVIFSLFWSWNLPAFLIDCAWALISGWGLARLYLKRSAS